MEIECEDPAIARYLQQHLASCNCIAFVHQDSATLVVHADRPAVVIDAVYALQADAGLSGVTQASGADSTEYREID